MRSTHEETLEDRLDRLENTGAYRFLERHIEYHTSRGNGELDIYGEDVIGRRYYFEVKSSFNQRSEAKAIQQFKRCAYCFPKYEWRFFLVTPGEMKEYYVRQPHGKDTTLERLANAA